MEFVREAGQSGTQRELSLEFTAGAAYRINDHFAAGLEVRERNVYPDMGSLDHAAVFAGPALHYSQEKWWVTFTVLPQIAALAGSTGNGLDLDEFERAEVRLILGIQF